LIAAAIAMAAVKGSPLPILGCLLLIVAYLIKGRLEERWLREELGAADYDAYSRRVPMLVPFMPTGKQR
jgi:protein-S-isoprenylcysteine O-methyltransferase Ste14